MAVIAKNTIAHPLFCFFLNEIPIADDGKNGARAINAHTVSFIRKNEMQKASIGADITNGRYAAREDDIRAEYIPHRKTVPSTTAIGVGEGIYGRTKINIRARVIMLDIFFDTKIQNTADSIHTHHESGSVASLAEKAVERSAEKITADIDSKATANMGNDSVRSFKEDRL